MSLNNLISLKESIVHEHNKIERFLWKLLRSKKPIERLLEFASESKHVVFGNNDA